MSRAAKVKRLHAGREPASARARGSIVPFHKAKLERIESSLAHGVTYEANDGRRVEVWKTNNPDGSLIVKIFRPTLDGKVAKLAFGLSQDAASALISALSRQLSNIKMTGAGANKTS